MIAGQSRTAALPAIEGGPMRLSPHEIAYVARSVWSSPADQRIAVAIALAESGGDTEALGRSSTGSSTGNRDHGLWQISGRWHGDKLARMPDWRNPEVNAHLAHQVWSSSSSRWAAWSTFNPPKDATGKVTGPAAYEKFLPDADLALRHPFPPPAQVDVRQLVADAVRQGLEGVATQVSEIRGHFASPA